MTSPRKDIAPRKRARGCGPKRKLVVMPGMVFGDLTVIREVQIAYGNGRSRRGVEAECSCGNKSLYNFYNVIDGSTSRCRACAGLLYDRNTLTKTHWGLIKRGAKSRGLLVTITMEEAQRLFDGQGGRCALTGWPIFLYDGKTTNPRTASLDRIDSSLGYVPGNVQWVHKDINMFKMAMPEDRFIELCTAVANHKRK